MSARSLVPLAWVVRQGPDGKPELVPDVHGLRTMLAASRAEADRLRAEAGWTALMIAGWAGALGFILGAAFW